MKNLIFRVLISTIAFCTLSAKAAFPPQFTFPGEAPTVEKTEADRASSDALKTIVIELELPSVATFVMDYKKEHGQEPSRDLQIEHAKKVSAQQEEVGKRLMSSMDITHVSNMRVGINGLKCRTDAANIEKIRSMPGVKNIKSVSIYEKRRYSPYSAKKDTKAIAKAIGNYTGKGVTIAIVDDGIDYFHKALGGSGDVAEYDSNDKTVIEPGTFPTEKVIAGYDLAGVRYNAFNPSIDPPRPDADPLGQGTHGTNVASIVAGLAVEGKLDAGVAPDAKLIAIKIFGDVSIGTDLVAEGIELSLDPNRDGSTDDRADIINLSLGELYGESKEGSATDLAIKMATELGVVVIAAAGNEGDRLFIHADPAVYEDTISVGSVNPYFTEPKDIFHIILSGGDEEIPVAARYYSSANGFSVDNISAFSAPLTLAPVELDCQVRKAYPGQVVMLSSSRLGAACGSLNSADDEYMAALGAEAIIIYSVHDDSPFYDADSRPFILSVGATYSVHDTSRDLILNFLDRHQDVVATFDPSNVYPDTSLNNVVSGFSSRGPSFDTYQLKPDVTAIGASVTAAQAGRGDGTTIISGTSFAAPLIAGLAAQIIERAPGLTPSEVKGLLMSHADPLYHLDDASLNLPFPLSRQGLGKVEADKVSKAKALITPASLSLGRLNPSRPLYFSKKVRLQNLGSEEIVYTARVQGAKEIAGVEVKAPQRVVLPANDSVDIRITFFFNPHELPVDRNSLDLSTVEGWVVLDDGENELRVGYYAVVDPASDIKILTGQKDGHLLANTSGSTGVATAYDVPAIFSNIPSEDTRYPAFKNLGYRTVSIDGKDFYEFVLTFAEPISSRALENFSLFVKPFDFAEQNFVYKYFVGSARYALGIAGDLTGNSNFYTYGLNGENPKKDDIIQAGVIDYDDTWVKFYLPKEDELSLLSFAGEDSFVGLQFEWGMLRNVNRFTGVFGFEDDLSQIIAGFYSNVENTFPQQSLELKFGESKWMKLKQSSPHPVMWFFENNQAESQSVTIGDFAE